MLQLSYMIKLCPSKDEKMKNFEIVVTWPFCLPPNARLSKVAFFFSSCDFNSLKALGCHWLIRH